MLVLYHWMSTFHQEHLSALCVILKGGSRTWKTATTAVQPACIWASGTPASAPVPSAGPASGVFTASMAGSACCGSGLLLEGFASRAALASMVAASAPACRRSASTRLSSTMASAVLTCRGDGDETAWPSVSAGLWDGARLAWLSILLHNTN